MKHNKKTTGKTLTKRNGKALIKKNKKATGKTLTKSNGKIGKASLEKKHLGQPNKPYLKLTLDLIFKAFFKDKSVSVHFLKHFLPLPKNRKIVSIDFLDPKMTSEQKKLKEPVLDLRARLDNKEHINIEVQTLSMKNFSERILYYLCSLYIDQLNRGKKYQTLYPTYSLVFTRFPVFPKLKDYYFHFFLRADKKEKVIFSKYFGIVLVDLSKFKARSLESLIDKKDLWSYLIKHSHQISKKELEVLSKKGGGMKAAAKRLSVLSEDENMRMLEEAREKNWRDDQARKAYALEKGMRKGRKAGIEEGLEKGREEGLEKGMQKGMQKVALNLLKKNIDISIISETTGLSKSEIKMLKKVK